MSVLLWVPVNARRADERVFRLLLVAPVEALSSRSPYGQLARANPGRFPDARRRIRLGPHKSSGGESLTIQRELEGSKLPMTTEHERAAIVCHHRAKGSHDVDS